MDTKTVTRDDARHDSPDLVARSVTGSEFDGLREPWDRLLAQSDADPLVMCWDWLHTWWETFAPGTDFELRILAVSDSNGDLLGLAPLYLTRERQRGLPVRRLQFLGNRWRTRGNIRSEYVDFLVRRDRHDDVLDTLLGSIAGMGDWDEFIVCNHWVDAGSTKALLAAASNRNWYVRRLERAETFQIDLRGDFETYLADLSAKTRLKLYNHRKKLENHGDVEIVAAGTDDVPEFLGVLNDFHNARWSKPLFADRRLVFHSAVGPTMARNHKLDMTMLSVGGRPVSILYDFVVDGTKYGFQMGFDQEFDRRLSLAQLHIGYAIESAFERGLQAYDFLRGVGRSKSSYKGSMTQPHRTTETLQIVRHPVHKLLLRLYTGIGNLRNKV